MWRSSRYHPSRGVHRIVSRSSNGTDVFVTAGGGRVRLTLLRDRRAGFRHAAIDFLDGLQDLRAPPFVSGRGQLALELGAREPQRFERVDALGIAHRLRLPVHARPFHLLCALLNPRFCVDESFARITHECPCPFPLGCGTLAVPRQARDALSLSKGGLVRLKADPTTQVSHYKIPDVTARSNSDPLHSLHPAVREWFSEAFEAPTRPQSLGWPAIARGESTLILAPTGSGKTLAAFLWCLDRVMFTPAPVKSARCRVLYVSPLKALAVDVERNLRAPLAGIAQVAEGRGDPYVTPAIAVRTGDTPQSERARFQREPADILITTPESLYLLLTSNARDALRSIDTVIIDEIHALVPTKRGAHLMLSLERLNGLCPTPPQRIGLSATQRPLDEVARFLGGSDGDRRPA